MLPERYVMKSQSAPDEREVDVREFEGEKVEY